MSSCIGAAYQQLPCSFRSMRRSHTGAHGCVPIHGPTPPITVHHKQRVLSTFEDSEPHANSTNWDPTLVSPCAGEEHMEGLVKKPSQCWWSARSLGEAHDEKCGMLRRTDFRGGGIVPLHARTHQQVREAAQDSWSVRRTFKNG